MGILQNVKIQIELDAFVQPSGVVEVLCGQNCADADLVFLYNSIPILRKRGITATVNAKIKNQHSFPKDGAVSFFPAACIDLVERNSNTLCQCVKVQLPLGSLIKYKMLTLNIHKIILPLIRRVCKERRQIHC